MNTIVLTCVYPGAGAFIPDFIASLAGQSYLDFALLIINDGLENCHAMFENVPFDTQLINLKGNPAKIRKAGIEWAMLNEFEFIVFADIDDCFEANRIEHSLSLLQNYPLVFNDLILFGAGITERESMYGGRFLDGQRFDATSILTRNCLGLSNSAGHLGLINNAAKNTSDNVIAFDWALFTRLLCSGKHALYTLKTRTYYRQHDMNVAGPRTLSDQAIKAGVSVKARHYEALKDLGIQYEKLGSIYSNLEARINADSTFAASYTSAVRRHAPEKPLWWETIRTTEELCL